MSHRIGDKNFCDIQIGLFTDENEYGLAVSGLEKILKSEKVEWEKNSRFRGWQWEDRYPEYIQVVNKEYEYKLWVMEIIKGNLSYKSIIKNLSKLENKYKENYVIKNDNLPVKKQLYNTLKGISKQSRIRFREYEFDAEKSIVNIKALLNDEEIHLFDGIKDIFDEQRLFYHPINNPISSFNALMIALENTYEIIHQKPLATSCSLQTNYL